jgi:hypothetical protein
MNTEKIKAAAAIREAKTQERALVRSLVHKAYTEEIPRRIAIREKARNNAKIDLPTVRKLAVPLLKRLGLPQKLARCVTGTNGYDGLKIKNGLCTFDIGLLRDFPEYIAIDEVVRKYDTTRRELCQEIQLLSEQARAAGSFCAWFTVRNPTVKTQAAIQQVIRSEVDEYLKTRRSMTCKL